MNDKVNFGPMTDREILVSLATDMRSVKDAVYGPPSLSNRLTALETRAEEPAISKKMTAGLSGLVAAVVVGIMEALRRGSQ